MKHHYAPNVGNWYKDIDLNATFEVVAIDDNDDSIEIQYFSGEIDEFDLESWYELELKVIPPPEDWSGPYELSKEDFSFADDPLYPEDWSGPLSGISLDNDY